MFKAIRTFFRGDGDGFADDLRSFEARASQIWKDHDDAQECKRQAKPREDQHIVAQRQIAIHALQADVVALADSDQQAATILLLAYPHAGRAVRNYKNEQPPLLPCQKTPFFKEIGVILHKALQQTMKLLSSTKLGERSPYGCLSEATIRNEMEKLILDAHAELVLAG